MAVTINEVAKEAGVSITTVSRVLNNNYPVKKETREKIEKAIEKLNYKPNIMARSLITKKSGIIAVIVPGITNLFFPTIVEEIGDCIKSKGYSITLCNTRGDYKTEKELIEQMLSRQVDGIIIIDPASENLKSNYYEDIAMHIPTIIVNGSPQGIKCNFVCYDEAAGAKEAFKHLIDLGHKKIAFLRGDRSLSYDIKEKIYKEILEENALEYINIIQAGGGNSIDVIGYVQAKLEEILSAKEKPTAIFACNDLMAVGAMSACAKFGFKVPEDISILGFDNTLLSSITHPSLTSVDQNMKETGRTAAMELIDIIENPSKTRKKIIIDTNLVIRESTGKVPFINS
ncbi:LacI family DNA-binding transcriptional regulator [Desnuesiella massiliensis]|uniref:LacI family DNA-binding transcriptional regulator n=1 Tax=Desnuesiella massiliensis TaxID=1650662 RepID=UPI000939C7DB|nr:LacI family DNA-binding transcriptional regulator [Desnuesiella massiliensis]